MAKKQARASFQWRTMDIHIHTPASNDFQQAEISYLDILQRAENRGLDIIAFTDHNTIAGYRKMTEEKTRLEFLEEVNRLLPEEKNRLSEYRRLFTKLLILPGIEFSATFGFHILGLFPPDKPIREIEHLLLSLNIPAAILDEGSANVGATTDVLTAYKLINQAGGLVIAAHANSSNGVAMRGFNFGGQTKIAYTQDPNLHALEVTDLEQSGGRTTAAFFNGTKPEYPRRMHCIQGSDAHRLTTDASRKKNPGIGDRSTEILLPEVSFDALREVFTGNDFSRTRPHHHKEEPVFDFIQSALEEGPNIIQDFHESATVRGGKLFAVLADICAFANTNGGTIYLGVTSEYKKSFSGIAEPEQAISQLEKELTNRITPPLQCSLDVNEFKGKKLIRILIPRGDDPPYALDDNKIYIRDEADTGLAVRDEIVGLVRRSKKQEPSLPVQTAAEIHEEINHSSAAVDEDPTPRTGVEVIPTEDRGGKQTFSMRDLRNGNVVKNVTRASARRLWHYAISSYGEIVGKIESLPIHWEGNFGVLKKHKQGKNNLYDFIQKTNKGYRYFYGVTPDGIHGPWKFFEGEED